MIFAKGRSMAFMGFPSQVEGALIASAVSWGNDQHRHGSAMRAGLQSSGASSPECNRNPNPELVPRPNISEPTPRCFHVEVAALRCDLELKSDRLLVYKIYVYKSPSPYS